MNGPLAIAQQFAELTGRLSNKADLAASLEACTLELGFRYFALVHHVDLRKARPTIIHIDNYPPHWSHLFIQSRFFINDPIFRASLTTNIGFCWDRVAQMIRMQASQRRILEAARREGLNTGFTVPANIPGEAHGSCSFASVVGQTFPSDCLLAAQLVGSFAFQAARRMCGVRCPMRLQAVQLTPRQRECLELVAQGKTDWEIGTILGLREDSVTKVIDSARHRYDVANRTELVVAALFDGQISFNEVRHWQYRFDANNKGGRDW